MWLSVWVLWSLMTSYPFSLLFAAWFWKKQNLMGPTYVFFYYLSFPFKCPSHPKKGNSLLSIQFLSFSSPSFHFPLNQTNHSFSINSASIGVIKLLKHSLTYVSSSRTQYGFVMNYFFY